MSGSDGKLRSLGRSEVDMTEGGIFSLLLNFTLPLLLGNIFQQLYNTVDTWVVGNYVGKTAFSAVGTLTPVINMLIGLSIGFSNGAGVVISQYFGAKDTQKVRSATHTFVAATLIMCALFTVVGILITPVMLGFLGSPPDVAAEQSTYLSIYFAGVTGLLIYNMGSAILRAVGNSSYPFIFLLVSAGLNIILDLVFVILFHWGTAGVAYATILSQLISAVLVVVVLLRTDSLVKVSVRDIRIDRVLFRKILMIGLPSALQMSITSFSNVFVQSYIYQFGVDCMGGWTAYSKLDQLLFLPMQSLAMAAMTFTGQNLGRGLLDRARRGTRMALTMALVSTAVLLVPVLTFASRVVTFFIDASETGVIEYGTMFIRNLSPFYLLCCVNQIYGGSVRGAGNSRAPMFAMIFSFVLFRQIYLFIVSNYISNTIMPIAFGYPLGWLVCSVLMVFSYRRTFASKASNAVLL